MLKKIKFPLELANGAKVRDIEGLRENFDAELMIIYFDNGKLVRWLKDRNYNVELKKIMNLKSSHKNFVEELCRIFEVECPRLKLDHDKIIEKHKKISYLRQFTEDESMVERIDEIAFDDEELIELINKKQNFEGKIKVYMCGEQFTIPLEQENIEYIGVNKVIARINSGNLIDFKERKIKFVNMKFDEKYKKTVEENGEGKSQNKNLIEKRYKKILSEIDTKVSEGSMYSIEKEMKLKKDCRELILDFKKESINGGEFFDEIVLKSDLSLIEIFINSTLHTSEAKDIVKRNYLKYIESINEEE